MRPDGRKNDQMREVKIQQNFVDTAEGSVLISMGKTRVICTASIEERVPPFLKDQKKGWVTAEYSMLPRSTKTRSARESATGRISGRTHEIQRLIGRALRSVVDLTAIGERTIWIDCDVLQADGGTRTAAITGGYIALYHAMNTLKAKGIYHSIPLKCAVAATSVGIVDREELLDLCYKEDFAASVDFNVVMTDKGEFVEIQGTAEGKPFTKTSVNSLLILIIKILHGTN